MGNSKVLFHEKGHDKKSLRTPALVVYYSLYSNMFLMSLEPSIHNSAFS